MRNPFRTKRIIIAGVKQYIIIEIPFFGDIKHKTIKTRRDLKGYNSGTIIIDEIKEFGGKNEL